MSIALIGLWILVISLALYTIALGGALLSLQRALRLVKKVWLCGRKQLSGNFNCELDGLLTLYYTRRG